jgi:hypothetical protein
METMLLAVTTVSLLVAAIASIAAWRVARAERARTTARVAALSRAASGHDLPGNDTPLAAPAAVAPPAAAATPSFARVSAFATPRPATARAAARMPDLDIYPDEHELPIKPSVSAPPAATASMADSFLGVAARQPSGGAQRGLAAAALVLFAVLGAGAYWLISSDPAKAAQANAVVASASAPLELISLRHERQGSRLTLTGLVRNPAAGAAIDGLTAVVFLFDAQGGFISSARAGVDFKRLAAGDESPFVIAIDAPSQVARYRVSFRTDAGVITHVDRRAEQPPATALASGTE